MTIYLKKIKSGCLNEMFRHTETRLRIRTSIRAAHFVYDVTISEINSPMNVKLMVRLIDSCSRETMPRKLISDQTVAETVSATV